jgi:DNA modification methylase
MVGQHHLPEIINRLTEHLTYRWVIAYLMGGPGGQDFPAKINYSWKPVLLFGESKNWIGDVARSESRDKSHHLWGQSESGMTDLVERLTSPGQLICDPFVGGGATAVASIAVHRRFIGCDIDPESVDRTITRVKAMP